MQASRYRISRLIQRGGTAEVFEAHILGEQGFERRVALKKLREEILSDEGFVEHFVDEGRIAAQLHHANVVSVFDFGVMDGRPFLVLEFVDGLDLGKLVERAGVLSPELTLAVTLEVARGLAYAHKAKDAKGSPLRIVHRDVSPSNVLVSFAGDVKLSDFGIALAVERLVNTRVGYVKGKLAFMSPEQMNGGGVDNRTDVYALGCLTHWMLTGRSPIEREEARDTVRRGGDCALAKEIDRDIAAILLRATKTDAARRYRSADELASEVGAALMRRVVDKDARTLLGEFMEKLAPMAGPTPRTPIAEMMDVELVFSEAMEPLRRFESIALDGQTALAEAHTTRELAPERLEKTEPGEPSESSGRPSLRTPVGADKLLGTVLHGYRLMDLLGVGSVARVYRAKHLVLEREYAVKVLFGRAGDNDRGKVRMHREAQALSKLEHPNIVQVFDFGNTEDGRPFLTMELLRGETLKALVAREGPLAPERAGQIARQLASGLEAAHQAELVHRDLKPANVMLVQENGREIAKILDFGIVRRDTEGTRITASDQLLGTPRYMAPEQIRGASNVGPAADLYALGAVLYMMLDGRPPFTGSTLQVIERQLSEKPRPLETGTPLDELVLWLLAKNPEERPASAERVVSWLDDAGYVEEVTRTQLMSDSQDSRDSHDTQASLESPATAVVNVKLERERTSRLLIPALFALLIAIGALAGALWWPRPTPNATRPEAVSIAPEKAPVVIARAERVEPPPPPVEVEPPPPRVDEPPAQKRSKVRTPKRAASPAEIERSVRASLKRRGLSRRDLASNPQTQALLRAFEAENDPEAMHRAADALVTAVEKLAVDDAMVKDKLDRVAKALSASAAKLDESALDRLENRYLDLRSSFRTGLSSAELSGLMIRIDVLEREIEQARR